MAIYALSDLHGELSLWHKIKNFLQEDDIVIFLGDAIDRGPAGIQLLQELLSDEQVIFICGNHEQNFSSYPQRQTELYYLRFLYENGGFSTISEYEALSDKEKTKIMLAIDNFPYYAEYTNENNKKIILTHAGFTPSKEIEKLSDKERKYNFLENRKHIDDKWPIDPKYENMIIVHGHTPTGIQDPRRKGKVIFYCDNHKINIDTGATFLGTAALLDLNTFSTFYFYKDSEGIDIYEH